ncbi:MAG: hypothetical protein FJW83_08015 [Actinobacteria bacterium]|nr:hypothetical protein [Actinomycetota bacterium]
MDLDHYLSRADLLSCDGTTSHTLLLELDGTVTIHFREGHRARVDPRTRTVLTRGMVLPTSLLDAACHLAGGH